MREDIKERIEKIKRGEVPEGYIKEQGLIYPAEWEIERMGNLGEFSKGREVSLLNVTNEGYPAMMYGDIYVKYDTKFYNTDFRIPESVAKKGTKISKGTLLYTCSGESAKEIGKCVVYLGDEDIYIGGDILAEKIWSQNPIYISYYQNSYPAIKQKAKLGQGHSIVHIYEESIRKIKIPLPDIKVQNKIVIILEKYDEVLDKLKKSISEKRKQKKWLVQNLLTGKMRLPGFEEEWKKVKLGSVLAEKSEKNNRLMINNVKSINT